MKKYEIEDHIILHDKSRVRGYAYTHFVQNISLNHACKKSIIIDIVEKINIYLGGKYI